MASLLFPEEERFQPLLIPPPDKRGPLAPDPRADALGRAYKAITGYMEGDASGRRIWSESNPVGTETLQSVGMPHPTTYAGPVGQFIDPLTGRMTEQGTARMDNPMLGFDTGGIGGGTAASGSMRAIREAEAVARAEPAGLLDRVLAKAEAAQSTPATDAPILRQLVAPGEADRISTRIPWAKPGKGEAPPPDPHLSSDLVVGIDSSRASGDAFAKNAEHIAGYSDVPTPMADPEGRTRALISHARDNLLYLHDSIPAEIRARSKLWYDGANVIAHRFGGDYGVSPSQAGGSLAALSPQKDWFQNVDLAKRLLDIRRDQGGTVATPEMMAQFDRFIAGQKKPEVAELLARRVAEFQKTPLSEIESPAARALWMRAFDEAHNPRGYRLVTPEGEFGGPVVNLDGSPRKVGWGSLDEIAKAVGAAEAPDLPTISRLMGSNHKVRNFYNNIVSPNARHGDVTIDTHAIAAAHMRPLAGSDREVAIGLGLSPGAEHAGTGSKGLYGGYAEAYRQAAAELGILPRELQSITWEGVRGLYSDVLKRNKDFTGGINDIWTQYGTGRLTGADARTRSVNAAGGIDPPEWWQPGAR